MSCASPGGRLVAPIGGPSPGMPAAQNTANDHYDNVRTALNSCNWRQLPLVPPGGYDPDI